MRRLFSILLGVILTAIVAGFLLWLAWAYVRGFAESYQLVMGTWVMAGFTIILAVFTILQGVATWGQLKTFREAHTWDRLRIHSEKLRPILIEWADKTVVSPGELNVEYARVGLGSLTKPSHKYFGAFWEHMKTGYKKDAEIWNTLKHEFKDHRDDAKNFFLMLENEMKRRVRLPTYSSKGKEPEEWFNSLRCAEIAYSVLTGKIKAEYYLKDSPPKIEPFKSTFYRMQWPPATTIAITKNKTECAVIEQAVTDLLEDPKMVKEGNMLSAIARDIDEKLGHFRDRLQTLIGVIELGGVLEGECNYCRRLKLG